MKTLRTIIFVLLTMVVGVAGVQAQDTGVYYDRTLVGEGIMLYHHTGRVPGGEFTPFRSFWFFTYGAEQCEIIVESVDHRIQREVTAEATAVCPNSIFPPFNPLCDPVIVTVVEILDEIVTLPSARAECDLNGQRWFYASDPIVQKDIGDGLAVGDSAGKFYFAEGINFPECVPSMEPFEEDVDICAEITQVGTYIMRPDEKTGGFLMWVLPVGDSMGDPLYDHLYEFTTLLVDPTVPEEAEPK